MIARIRPGNLAGTIAAAPSKSYAHRWAIAAALAGDSVVENAGFAEDVEATIGAMHALGYRLRREDDGRIVSAAPLPDRPQDASAIDCGESGSTLRFALPLAMDGRRHVFAGRGRLLERPLAPYKAIADMQGIVFAASEGRLTVEGRLQAGRFELPGDVSSQFVSGLLFALPTLEVPSTIAIAPPVESRAYIDMTLDVLARFGVEAAWKDGCTIEVSGSQRWRPAHVAVEGDWSNAAFFVAAGVLGGGVRVEGLRDSSLQGDRAIIERLRDMGAIVAVESGAVGAMPGALRGIDADASQIPDLVPVLAALGACATGVTRIRNAARLRHKESDRLAAMACELRKMGAGVEELVGGLTITGGRLHGAALSAHGDHRIAMALAVAATAAEGESTIDDAACVAKSAPGFWTDFRTLGGKVEFMEG